MSAYIIVTVDVKDHAKYEGYRALSGPAVAAAGGKFIVRGGAMEVLEGSWPLKRVVVIEFPSVKIARAFYDSEQYLAAREARKNAANLNMIIVEGM